MDITERLKQRFNVPENWDKHDYEIHRYSFDDLLEAAELVKESDSLPCVRISLPSDGEIHSFADVLSLRSNTRDRMIHAMGLEQGATWIRNNIREQLGSES